MLLERSPQEITRSIQIIHIITVILFTRLQFTDRKQSHYHIKTEHYA